MSDKALLTDAELELTQKIQRQFPRGVHPDLIKRLNDCPKEIFGANLSRFIQNEGRLQVVTTNGIIAPPKGIVRTLTAPVNESRAWNETMRAAGPDTPKNCNIWKVGDQYPPILGAVERLEEIYVVNFGKDSFIQSKDAIAWGKKQHLVPASPRACFSIAEHLPKLNSYLEEVESMSVVSLRECSVEGQLGAVGVWFSGSKREADLFWFGRAWDGGCWFAFVRELRAGLLRS